MAHHPTAYSEIWLVGLDGIGKEKVEPVLKRLKKGGLVFGKVRGGKTHHALTVKGKEISRSE